MLVRVSVFQRSRLTDDLEPMSESPVMLGRVPNVGEAIWFKNSETTMYVKKVTHKTMSDVWDTAAFVEVDVRE